MIQFFGAVASKLHKKLQEGFEKRTAAANVMAGSRANRMDLVPDLTDYTQLWLSLQLLAARKSTH